MLTKVLNIYKAYLLIALTLFVVILGVTVERRPVEILLLLAGCLLGAILLDVDYILSAYILDPDTDFSNNLKGYIQHKDILGSIIYMHTHKNDIKEKTLHSALFQIVLTGLMLFVVSSDASIFIKALVVSTLVNSIYRMYEEYFAGNMDNWFWSFKTKPGKQVFIAFSLALLIVLVYTFTLL